MARSMLPPATDSPEERLRKIGLGIYQNEQIVKSARPGSPEFNKAEKALKTLRAELQKVNAEIDAKRAGERKSKADKAKAKAEEDLQRANALGDEKAAQDARTRIENAGKEAVTTGDAKTFNQQRQEEIEKSGVRGYTGSGTEDKPLTLGGERYTGTYKGKKYQNGILVTTPTKGDGAGAGAGDGDKNKAKDKTIWVSYLRKTFADLGDKAQKAQIDGLFDTAIKQNWDEDTFMEALEGTAWWQETFPSLRSFFLESNDPRNAATFAEKITNNMDSIMGKLEALGITPKQVDPQTGRIIDNSDFIKGIAVEAIKNNWDDNQLENYLSKQGSFLFTGGGTIGSYFDRIKSTAYLYGINIDANLQQAINNSLLDPLDGRDFNYWVNSMKQQALDAPQNKPFAESLKAGRSLYEVTNSYRQQMANLLEVDSTAITWDDLMGKIIDKDTNNARTFADFTKALKQDPLWQYTRNAKETYSGMALDLAKMFGFAG